MGQGYERRLPSICVRVAFAETADSVSDIF